MCRKVQRWIEKKHKKRRV